jgi:hypothetical protein
MTPSSNWRGCARDRRRGLRRHHLDAVRAALRRLFVCFLFHPEKPRHGEAHLLVGGHYRIGLREETLVGYGDWLRSLLQAERPVGRLIPIPLEMADLT